MNESEEYVSQVNSNIFFQEFTFSKNKFCPPDIETKSELELADNVVWLDDILFVYQIKGRNEEDIGDVADELKWYQKKILKKATKQIKDTVRYLSEFSQIFIENERGYKQNIAEAPRDRINKLVIFAPSPTFPNEQRFQKFYDSKTIGLIHLFHIEDYLWICKYLITPAEIAEYLGFREELYLKHQELMDNFPEQYVLGHFLATDDTEEIRPEYIENLKTFKQEYSNVELLAVIELFRENMTLFEKREDYFHIVKEIAKLNRSEFHEFKKRFFLMLKKCQDDELRMPYRIVITRTGCGFVFVPLPKKFSGQWKTGLNNFTFAHKYEQKLDKCVGIVGFQSQLEDVSFEVFWFYAEFPWAFDAEMGKVLSEKFPFEKLKYKQLERYKFS